LEVVLNSFLQQLWRTPVGQEPEIQEITSRIRKAFGAAGTIREQSIDGY
jgi:hypothetical protein